MEANDDGAVIEDHQAELTVMMPRREVDPHERLADLFSSTCGRCEQPLGKHATVQITFHLGEYTLALDHHHLPPGEHRR